MERAKIQNPNMGLRWVVLFTILLNVAFSYLSYYLPGIRTMENMSARYPTLITPADFTFSVWALIYVSFVVYGITQLMPSEKGKWIYDHLAGPVIFIQVMGILWVMALGYGLMNTSLAILILMLLGGISAFARAKHDMLNPAYSRLITLPFSLFLAWISIALIVFIAVYLRYQDIHFSANATVNYAGLMLTLAFLLAMTISLVFRDWVFPLVVAWAFYGIRATDLNLNEAIAELAMIGAVVLALWGIGYGIYRSAKLRQFLHDYRQIQARHAAHRS